MKGRGKKSFEHIDKVGNSVITETEIVPSGGGWQDVFECVKNKTTLNSKLD